MRGVIRRHVTLLTVVLSTFSLALIVSVAGGIVPADIVPAGPQRLVGSLPHLNAAISVLALIAIGTGVRAIRRGEVETHRRRMLLAFGLFVVFLLSYLYRLVLAGTTTFAGPTVLEPVYYTLLAVHIGLAMVSLPLVYYVLLLAYSYDVVELPSTNHAAVGRVAAGLWSTSFALGIVVYLVLYVVFPA
ncbi:MAG: DUF420 domain-containing protein [archaeon]